MSLYLKRKCHTCAEAEAEMRLRDLRAMEMNFTAQAEGHEEEDQEASAALWFKRARTIQWALLQIDPMTEGPRQAFDAMHGSAAE